MRNDRRPADGGLYRVQATSYQAGESGRYSLSLTEGGASGPAPASNPIPPPTLVSNTAMLRSGRPGPWRAGARATTP
jgi:hypothetical protein